MEPIEIITGITKYPAPFTHRVLILCHEKNIPYTITKIDTEEKPAWFLKIAPVGLIPVIRANGHVIFDSNAILEYLDNEFKSKLLPQDPVECAQHRSWIGFANELSQEIAGFVKSGKMLQHDLSRMKYLFAVLNEKIKVPYFFGEKLSLVDIALISHILWIDALEQKYLPFKLTDKYPKVLEWLLRMKSRSSICVTMGENYATHFIQLLEQYTLIEKM